MPPLPFNFLLDRLFCEALVHSLEFFFPAVDRQAVAKRVRLTTSDQLRSDGSTHSDDAEETASSSSAARSAVIGVGGAVCNISTKSGSDSMATQLSSTAIRDTCKAGRFVSSSISRENIGEVSAEKMTVHQNGGTPWCRQ